MIHRFTAKDLIFPMIATLTLGLAPFRPMPHVFEKLQWLASGHSFAPIDVFDLFMHGAPWVWLMITLILVLASSWKRGAQIVTDGS